jgi:hypothetical protein
VVLDYETRIAVITDGSQSSLICGRTLAINQMQVAKEWNKIATLELSISKESKV